jgi:hypothetical protein
MKLRSRWRKPDRRLKTFSTLFSLHRTKESF